MYHWHIVLFLPDISKRLPWRFFAALTPSYKQCQIAYRTFFESFQPLSICRHNELCGQVSESSAIYLPVTPVRTCPPAILDSPPNLQFAPYPPTSPKPTNANKHIVVNPEEFLPTPRQSLGSDPRKKLLESFCDLHSRVISRQLESSHLDNVYEDDLKWLKKKGEAGDIPDWDNIRLAIECLCQLLLNTAPARIDYMNGTIIIQCPTWQHKSIVDVIKDASANLSRVRIGGAPDLSLFNGLGVKTPDLVLCDRDRTTHSGFPTVAFEVAFSQSQASLNYNAARLLFGSRGKINTVVNIKVTKTGMAEAPGELKSLLVDVWRMTVKVVDERLVENLPRQQILMKENKVASSDVVSWFFSYITTARQLYHLKAKPHHYQVCFLVITPQSNSLIRLDLSRRSLRWHNSDRESKIAEGPRCLR